MIPKFSAVRMCALCERRDGRLQTCSGVAHVVTQRGRATHEAVILLLLLNPYNLKKPWYRARCGLDLVRGLRSALCAFRLALTRAHSRVRATQHNDLYELELRYRGGLHVP
jgi:hypothetical protein